MTSNLSSSSLLVLAAGMGSRYGGLKQVDPVGPNAEALMDYSIYDAIEAGFTKVVFLIREEMKDIFDEQIGSRYLDQIDVQYAFQKLEDLPPGVEVPVTRSKPWGTGHAVWCARDVLEDSNFSVINADDFYGRETFSALHESMQSFSLSDPDDGCIHGAIVGFRLKETLSDHGSVSRGICQLNDSDFLHSVEEWSDIQTRGDLILGKNAQGAEKVLDSKSVVSMNVWAFQPTVFHALEKGFSQFLNTAGDLERDEFYLPAAVDHWISSRIATFQSRLATCQWMGVTYREDKPKVMANIRNLISAGIYPASLFN
ncbi:MAG: nucleotidyltransferase [Opitutae bacterium]|nr:nucleotidyltransferase [Opitutae bacterium]